MIIIITGSSPGGYHTFICIQFKKKFFSIDLIVYKAF